MLTIGQQYLDLSWRDAWKHELRGPHGEWEKSAAAVAAAAKETPEGSYSLRLAPDGLPNPSPESLALARSMIHTEGATAGQREAIARVLGDNLDNIPPQMRTAMARTHKVRWMSEEDNSTGGVLGVTGAWKGSWEIRIRKDVLTGEMDQSVTDDEDEGKFIRTDGGQKYRALRHTVTHEFGHALFETGLLETGDIYTEPGSDDAYQKRGAMVARNKAADDMLGALGGPPLADTDRQRAKFLRAMKSLSKYGAFSIDEAMAESYTAFALSGKGADGSVKARSAGRVFLTDAERVFASSPAGTGMELNLAAPGDVPYRGCSGLPASPADFERLYGTPEARAAAARAWGLPADDGSQLSTIGQQYLEFIGDGHGHHIPGTPVLYRHGWKPVNPDIKTAEAAERAVIAKRVKGTYSRPLPLTPDPGLAAWPVNQPHATFQAVSDYVANFGAAAINGALRTQTMPSGPRSHEVAHLDAAISKYTVQEDSTVWRGVALTPAWRDRLKPGAVFSDLGYTSTTVNKQSAVSYAHFRSRGLDQAVPAMMEISVPAGTHTMPGKPALGEYVMPRGTRYRVDSVSPDGTQFKVSMLP